VSAVQFTPSLHEIGVPAQIPAAQVSPVVQTLLSLHGAVLGGLEQPVAGSQTSSVQGLPSLQSGGGPPTHTPFEHASFVVQALPSLHGPGTGAPPWQIPALHDSPVVQTLASSQLALLFVCTQPVSESQESSVHGLPSSQLVGPPPWQFPFWQKSPDVHSLPSSHGPVLDTWRQPVTVSQESSVQLSESLQLIAGPPMHVPERQVSFAEQALPSSQGAELFV
jgi:hypothetical protein